MTRLMRVLEEGFIFRRLGICYDFRTSPEAFPLPTLPTAEEARMMKPNPQGRGTGMGDCAENSALLFDGYLLRIELGLAHAEEERILDRLIGGLIRTATTAPKNRLVCGLTADGRGFYPQSSLATHLAWAFATWRCCETSAIAMESQEKLRNITERWIARLLLDLSSEKEKSEKPRSVPPVSPDPKKENLAILALLAAATAITRSGEWRAMLEEKMTEKGGDLFRTALAVEPLGDPSHLLPCAMALHLLIHTDPDIDRVSKVKEAALRFAEAAIRFLSCFRNLQPALLEEAVDPDWRKQSFPSDSTFDWPPSWRRWRHEAETVGASLAAGWTMVVLSPRDLLEAHTEILAECLRAVPWEKMSLASAIAPALSLHARGTEVGLWDQDLLESRISRLAEPSLVAQYLTPEYDDLHPDQAGHTRSPKDHGATSEEEKEDDNEEAQEEPSRKGRTKRRKRRR